MADELAVKSTDTDMVRPSYIPVDTTGTEHITKDDIQLPRILLAQKLSPQLEEDDSKFIEDLKFGDYFNDLTEENLGRGPINFVILRSDSPRWVEFHPFDSGGGIKDMNVPAGDDRTKFGDDGEPPDATCFYDFVVYLPDTEDIAVLSFKGTGIKAAKRLNGYIVKRRAAIYSGMYQLLSNTEKNVQGIYAVPVVKQAGWVSEENLTHMEEFFDSYKEKNITVEREVEGEEVPF